KLNQLDPVAYSALVIYSLLTTPEDGRWANYMLVKMAEDVPCYRLVAIDNDHNLVAPLEVDKKVGRILHFKSALFCLDAAKGPLHPLIVKRLLEMDAIASLEAWLKQLAEMAVGFDICFDEGMREKLFKQNQFVRMLLPTRSVVRIYQNMQCLQEKLKQQPEMTILAILRALWPVVGLRYEVTFTQADAADKRFEQLEQEDKISKALAQLHSTQRSTRTMRELHCSIKDEVKPVTGAVEGRYISKKQFLGIKPHAHINTPTYHKEELQLALIEYARLEEIRKQLNNSRLKLAKRIVAFNSLLLDKHMKKVIETSPWQMWPRDLQEKVIERLILGVNLRSLRLKNTSILRDKELGQIAQSCVSLEEIRLEECSNIEATGIAAIAYHCRSLRSLRVTKLRGVREWPLSLQFGYLWQVSVEIDWPVLETLTVDNCQNISGDFSIDAPRLQRLTLSRLAIRGITLKSEAMRWVSYSRLPQVNILSGVSWLHRRMKLERLIVQDCPGIAEINLKALIIKHKQWACLDWVEYFEEATGTMDVSSLAIDLFDWPTVLEAWLGDVRLRKQAIKHLVALGKGFTPLAAKKLMEVCPELIAITVTNYLAAESEIKKRSIIAHSDRTCLALLHDGRIVSSSKDRTLKIWNIQTGRCEQILESYHDGGVDWLAV
ncbi:MAG: hypothetical protein ACK4PR_11420, partial [Gammaproteobacteria bacterium]